MSKIKPKQIAKPRGWTLIFQVSAGQTIVGPGKGLTLAA